MPGRVVLWNTRGSLSQNTSYDVQVRAENDEGTSDWSATKAGMTTQNQAPVFVVVQPQSVNENSTLVVTVTATDADDEDSITGYAITGGADQTQFSIISETGVLSFSDAPDFERPADGDNNNAYIVVVTATSGETGRALTATQTITVTVINVTDALGMLAAPIVTATTLNSLTVTWEVARSGLDFELGNPVDVALDISGGKIYWADTKTNKIQRASLDGSNIEDFIAAGLNNPGDIALDISRDKIYWTEIGRDKISDRYEPGHLLDLGRGRCKWGQCS